jgi:hypothetical protein
MEFYTCTDIKTDLPITRYRGEITEINKLEDGAIAFIEALPLGNNQQRLIPTDAVFIGTLQEATKFYQSDIVAITRVTTFIPPILQGKSEPEPEPEPEAEAETETIKTSLKILERFTCQS